MTNFRLVTTSGSSQQAIRQSLLANARHELDTLRAELETRLAALETALALPNPPALERLVIDLARVATAEAESAAVRATLEAQTQAQDDAGVAVAE
ncbi:MAG TPA: hypothetical protein VFI56_01905, partial [Vicinamibacterales bacterium]|nr:hypothetical protein [Vicinamibacterales bacterium]